MRRSLAAMLVGTLRFARFGQAWTSVLPNAAARYGGSTVAPAIATATGHAGHARRKTRDYRMLWSGGRRTAKDEVTVNIERPSLNSRRISGSIVIEQAIEDVWLILTDYDRLATYVPNLTQSKQVEHPEGGIRLFQEGSQKIVGFDFRASLTMDMEEHYGDPDERFAQRKITFKLADSAMFTNFDGEWRLQFNSRVVNKNALPGEDPYTYSTKLFYMVNIRPKGPVPVLALEWQVSEEVPNNLKAVKLASEAQDPSFFQQRKIDMESRTLKQGVIVDGMPVSLNGPDERAAVQTSTVPRGRTIPPSKQKVNLLKEEAAKQPEIKQQTYGERQALCITSGSCTSSHHSANRPMPKALAFGLEVTRLY
ncbi:unnamed protein product [Chrysoparadoxa australica]